MPTTPPPDDVEVALEGIEKRFDEGDGAALTGISIAVKKGELLVVVGPSGCGKSTTLRIIAGLEHADGGTLAIGGRPMNDVPPQDRDVAMVFQGYALYPQMTVRENIEFPLRMRKVDKAERRKRSDEAVKMLRLERLVERLPGELSGGERQRVAMGRAIVRRPRVFLFDEPLSNLDAALRQELRVEIGALVRALGVTAVYVTHDQVEAMTLGDRICVMDKGKVLQIAAPREIYERPATSFVGTFLGAPRMNLMPARLDGDALALGPFRLPASAELRARAALAKELVVGVRPEGLAVRPDGEAELVVALSEPLGAETHLLLRGLGGEDVELRARVPGFDPRRAGERVRVSVDPSRLHLFDAAEGGARIA